MRSILNRKSFILLFSVLALGLLLVLASGLREIEFDPGIPFAWNNSERVQVEENLGPGEKIVTENKLAFWLLFLTLIALISYLFIPELRKRLLRILLNIGLTLFILNYLYENRLLSLPGLEGLGGLGADQTVSNAEGSALTPVFIAPDDSSALSYIISFGLLFTFLLSAWYLYRWWMRLHASTGVATSLPDLAAIARRSLKDISSGRNWEGVIQECYWRMSDSVDRNRGLKREHAMTTGEFARRLERAGLPGRSVGQLTLLFNDVRYGAHKTSKKEIDAAVSCLTDILHACGETL